MNEKGFSIQLNVFHISFVPFSFYVELENVNVVALGFCKLIDLCM